MIKKYILLCVSVYGALNLLLHHVDELKHDVYDISMIQILMRSKSVKQSVIAERLISR